LRNKLQWRLRTRSIDLGARTLVMGILNLTPDSFSDGGRFRSTAEAIDAGLQMLDEGADLLDLGAESTRPGSHAGNADAAVNSEEETSRLLPVLRGILKARPEVTLSVDTYKAKTARAALAAGAEIVNDVSGLLWDEEMAQVCEESRCGVVLMQSRGKPEEWASQPRLKADELLPMVRAGLVMSLERAHLAGVAEESIVLDPGYGFGKRFEENYALLANQAELLALGRPLLAGVSRKSFLGRTLAGLNGGVDAPADARETASLAAMVTAILNGASIVRVHTVRASVVAARIADAVGKFG
jgi:dihydropteroate synthase